MPPPSGRLWLEIPVAPVSFQGSAAKKEIVKAAVGRVAAAFDFILTDDVKLHIDWLINPHERYESDAAADVDNIVKPILDALVGPTGLLVDDCQVQSLGCLWRDRFGAPESLQIEIQYEPDAWFPKEHLVFLRLPRGLAYPISTEIPAAAELLVDHLHDRVRWRDEVNSRTGDRQGDRTLPIQRLFHVSKVGAFRLFDPQTLRLHLRGLTNQT